jgi:hypothetical protein
MLSEILRFMHSMLPASRIGHITWRQSNKIFYLPIFFHRWTPSKTLSILRLFKFGFGFDEKFAIFYCYQLLFIEESRNSLYCLLRRVATFRIVIAGSHY